MERMLVDAPFGNGRRVPGTTPILGPFTLNTGDRHRRRVRPCFSIAGYRQTLWADQAASLGELCNTLATTGKTVQTSLLGLSDWYRHNWDALLGRAAGLAPAGVVIDATTMGGYLDTAVLFKRARIAFAGTPVIVRLPPIEYMPLVARAADAGLTGFMCCGPLPVPGGGLHGRPLQEISVRAVSAVNDYLHAREYAWTSLIGAGGILCWWDVARYMTEGATHVAVGGLCSIPIVGRDKAAKLAAQFAFSQAALAEPIPTEPVGQHE